MHKHMVGESGEEQVAQYLEREGFAILARNYTISSGEVDIIARKHTLTIFVEVKTRSNFAQFDLSEVISPSKQKKVARAAKHWMLKNPCFSSSYRFDVALIEHEEVTYIPDAFYTKDM